MESMTAAAALRELENSRVIRDAMITERICFKTLTVPTPVTSRHVPTPISFVNCVLADVDAACEVFSAHVVFENCRIKKALLHATYFLGGISVRNCRFQSDVDFQAGGHNNQGATVGLYDTVFEGFVNFADCLFLGPVEVRRCRFMKGTNLLGNRGDRGTEVEFHGGCLVDENVGDVAKNGEDAA